MQRAVAIVLFAVVCPSFAQAKTLRVPADHKSIQAAIDAAESGDVVLVEPGLYRERLRLRPGITVRSRGDDEKRGALGLRRAEACVLDAAYAVDAAGVIMAAGSTLDGFMVTNVGRFDLEEWKKHHATQGEELADDEGAIPDGPVAEPMTAPIAGISIPGVQCSVLNNIVHGNGFGGIAAIGGKANASPLIAGNHCFRNMGGGIAAANGSVALIRDNLCRENLRAGIGCRKAAPLIFDNECAGNVRAGIGCREGATPVVRGNKCWGNRRAGIGIRMKGTSPIVEDNKCFRNDMAGIGCRDGASPLIRRNECQQNKLAGIGVDGASPLIVGNKCTENKAAGIGMRGGAKATLRDNECTENRLVAIGVTQGSEALIQGNRLMRTGGAPPLIAVLVGSKATLSENKLYGGGVAALMVLGEVRAFDNRFYGDGEKQGNAIWIRESAAATISNNQFSGYLSAVQGTGAKRLLIIGNTVHKARRAPFVIRQTMEPVDIRGNQLISENDSATVVEISGPQGVVANNQVIRP